MIVVFGGTGFIGGALVDRLRARGAPVELVTRRPERAMQSGFRFGDLLRPETLNRALDGATKVVQSTTFPGYPREKPRRGMTFETYDAQGTERLVEAAKRAGVTRYVYVSGVGVTPDATKPYYRAIARAERAVLGSGISSACLRPAFVYGPRDNGLNVLIDWGRKVPLLPVPGLSSRHQPVHVDDVARVLEALVQGDVATRPGSDAGSSYATGVFEIGGPEQMSMGEMIERAFRKVNVSCRLVPVPKGLALLGGRVLSRLPGELLTPSAVDFICEDFLADNTRALALLGRELLSFEQGLDYLIHGRDSG